MKTPAPQVNATAVHAKAAGAAVLTATVLAAAIEEPLGWAIPDADGSTT